MSNDWDCLEGSLRASEREVKRLREKLVELRSAAQSLADVLPQPSGHAYPGYFARAELEALRKIIAERPTTEWYRQAIARAGDDEPTVIGPASEAP